MCTSMKSLHPADESHTGMYSEPVPTVPDTPVDLLYCIYTESGPHRRHRQLFHSSNCTAGLLTRPRVLADAVSAVQVQAIALTSHQR